MRLLSSVCVAVWLARFLAVCETQAAAEPLHSVWEAGAIEATDLDGGKHSFDDGARTVDVVVFVSPTCPISNGALPRLRTIADELTRAAGPDRVPVRFFGVVADDSITRDEAITHFQVPPLPFPVLWGGREALRSRLRPTHAPEALVIDLSGRVAYRGAIDDAYDAVGRRRPAVTRRWLADAIAAVVAGIAPGEAFVAPVGCRLEIAGEAAPETNVTFARDVAPIVHARCVSCHRAGEVAPFPLTNCAEVAAHAPMIVETIRAGIMPPWMPAGNDAHPFLGDRRLTPKEIETITVWAEGGCEPGDPDDEPALPTFTAGWQLGPPDLVVRMPEAFTVPADSPDILQHFVIPIDIPEDKVVAAIDFHPGAPRVVHHAVLFLDTSGAARRLDAATREPGYGKFAGPGFLPSGALGGWSPGNTPRRLPGGRGRHLQKGSDLVVQIHYHPDGVEARDRSEVGLYFIDEPTAAIVADRERLVGSLWTSAYCIDIPAGDAAWRTSASYTLPKGVTVVGVVPHMHLLGKEVNVRAVLPDGSIERLVEIPAWNYAWQDEFYYQKPFPLPAGTRIVMEGVFDNSAANPSNPSKPPRRVVWGDGTLDEMLFCFLLVSAERTEDLVHVVLDNLRHDLAAPRQPRGPGGLSGGGAGDPLR
jgi:mono/diheme cytochrome c family protein